jgi:hypothetical protein
MPTKKTLTGAALKANRRRVLIDTARADMTSGHPDSIVALLVQAEKARPTRNPEPLRPEIRHAVAAVDAACSTMHGLIDARNTLGLDLDDLEYWATS